MNLLSSACVEVIPISLLPTQGNKSMVGQKAGRIARLDQKGVDSSSRWSAPFYLEHVWKSLSV
ncbi:hypothetical protein YOLOSWAG_199 [Erwinia phage vB_EamM_Yoloswag]|uniref:Uncharacterized protein n=1 Tax=Erwinia phage vB_EamM_Yoloswag TaxID=1958956 RepID=A0A1S6L3R4_9CAUD|nr:hypothetical protein HOR66_gp199 [Erwinia phage vB_EamM_Yoloswag]AQT28818.1 hypothetical protein YOLOSWAG_199 [Erwinia phage vB_EamM_Yoloswag]